MYIIVHHVTYQTFLSLSLHVYYCSPTGNRTQKKREREKSETIIDWGVLTLLKKILTLPLKKL